MDNALPGILAKAEVKILEVLESINLNILSSLKRVIGMESGTVNITSMTAVHIHSTPQAVANVLQKCKEIGIMRDGALLRNLESVIDVESDAFTNKIINTLKIIGIDDRGLQQMVGMELPELQKVVDSRDSNF
jgi:hypothetical protein